MRSIKFRNGKWIGYDGKKLHNFETKEEAFDWQNGIEKTTSWKDTYAFVRDELVEKFGGDEGF